MQLVGHFRPELPSLQHAVLFPLITLIFSKLQGLSALMFQTRTAEPLGGREKKGARAPESCGRPRQGGSVAPEGRPTPGVLSDSRPPQRALAALPALASSLSLPETR